MFHQIIKRRLSCFLLLLARGRRCYGIVITGLLLGLIVFYQMLSTHQFVFQQIRTTPMIEVREPPPVTCTQEFVQNNLNLSSALRFNPNPCYLSFPNETALRIHCGTCAVVIPSGHLIGKERGKDIDSHDCVIRSNNAPTNGYEKDVGFRTTIRMSSENLIRAAWKQFNKEYDHSQPLFDRLLVDGTIIIQYGLIFPDKIKFEMLKRWPKLKFYYLNKLRQDATMKRFREEVKHIMPTNGFRTLHYVQDFCNRVFVYGLSKSDYCNEVESNKTKDMPYNYYTKEHLTECLYHVKMKSIHSYEIEKQLIEKYLYVNPNYHFIEPDW